MFLIHVHQVTCSWRAGSTFAASPGYNVFYPRSCTKEECLLGIKWDHRSDSNWINFTLMARTKGESVWAAVGFSENGRMVSCFMFLLNYCGIYVL